MASEPPSTKKTEPQTKPASGLSIKRMTLAIWAGSAVPPQGTMPANCFMASPSSASAMTCSLNGVRVMPGATAFRRTPAAAYATTLRRIHSTSARLEPA